MARRRQIQFDDYGGGGDGGGGDYGLGALTNMFNNMYGNIETGRQFDVEQLAKQAEVERGIRSTREAEMMARQKAAEEGLNAEMARALTQQQMEFAKTEEGRKAKEFETKPEREARAQELELAGKILGTQGLAYVNKENMPLLQTLLPKTFGPYMEQQRALAEQKFQASVNAYKNAEPRDQKEILKGIPDPAQRKRLLDAVGQTTPQAPGSQAPSTAGQPSGPSVGQQIMSEKGVPISDLIVPREIKLLTNPPLVTVDPELQSPQARARGGAPVGPAGVASVPAGPIPQDYLNMFGGAANLRETYEKADIANRINNDPRFSDVGYSDLAKMAIDWWNRQSDTGAPPPRVVTGGPSPMPPTIQRPPAPTPTPAPLPWPGSVQNNYSYGPGPVPPPEVTGTPTNVGPDELLRRIQEAMTQKDLPWTYGNPLKGTQPLPTPVPQDIRSLVNYQ